MARGLARLTALGVAKAKTPGTYADGGGLYLQITASGVRSWLFRFMLNGRAREMGLGPLHSVTLAEARQKAAECRQLRTAGVDPIEAREKALAATQLEAAKAVTFREAAAAYIEAHRAGWRNGKHANQWTSSLEKYVYPTIGDLPVQAIDTGLVIKVLEPIWKARTETASRIRGRIEMVLDAATARGHREGENPARWRGHLDNLLPRKSRLRQVKHHAALPYMQIGTFIAALREQAGFAALALEFLILTAARTGEVIGARWREVDVANKVWTVPKERIKAGKEHRVPLTDRAVQILETMKRSRFGSKGHPSAHIFSGWKRGQAMSGMAMLEVLERMGRTDLTVHGFRSTFRDWTAEQTNHSREVAEMALAHTVDDKVEAAYRRGDLFEKRRDLMDQWAKYCDVPYEPVLDVTKAA